MADRGLKPQQALQRLLDGNRRYVAGEACHGSGIDAARRTELVQGQAPFAALIACADSRVAPELVLDVGLGDLFDCRIAGNLVDEQVLGSVDFALLEAGCVLVCVMGHTRCGAVTAAVEAAGDPGAATSPHMGALVRGLTPAVLATRGGPDQSPAEWIDSAARRNVELMCGELLQRSAVLTEACRTGAADVAGLWYDLSSGVVEVLVPPQGGS